MGRTGAGDVESRGEGKSRHKGEKRQEKTGLERCREEKVQCVTPQ